MSTTQPPQMEPQAEHYRQMVEDLRVFTGMILLSFAKGSPYLTDRIIRNFIARGMASIQSINIVWETGAFQDCWILHRCLLDRLLHLGVMCQQNSFSQFEEYSFVRQYEAKNRLMSDPAFRTKRPREELVFTAEQQRRYKELKQRGISWKRPDAEDAARNMGLAFIYRYSYDYASTHIHPMADDGEEDFARVIGIRHDSNTDDSIVMSDSLLVFTLLVQEGLNASTLRWRKVVYNFIEEARKALEHWSTDHRQTLYTIADYWPNNSLCEPAREV